MSKKFTLFVEDYNVPPHPWLLWNDVFDKGLRQETKGKLFIDSLFIFRNGQVFWGPDAQQFAAAGAYFLKRLQAEPALLKEVVGRHYLGFRKVKEFSRFCRSLNWQKLSATALAKVYERFYDIWIEIGIWGVIPQYVEMGENNYSLIVEKELSPLLSKFGDPALVFSRLLSPTKTTYLRSEMEASWRLLANWQTETKKLASLRTARSWQDLPLGQRRALQLLSKRFGWLQYYYDGQATSPEYYFELLKGRWKMKAAKVLLTNKREREELQAWQKKVEKTLSAADRRRVNLLRDFSLIKELRKEMQIYYLNYTMSPWFAELGRRLFCSQTQAKYLTSQEIRDFLYKKKKPNVASLAERYRLSAYSTVSGKDKVSVGTQATAFLKMMKVPSLKMPAVDSISGQVAYPGKAKGLVKIVNAVADIKKFQAGDILVSFSTNPSLVPAMNRAAAIITNTGGITCHAAIVSREMKKPCIIGTKIATRILKDGDLVEVDADKGVVKIIK
jgi:phosphohistidine swiveling domain-containing protein